jgi:hypothetical protein
VGLERHCCSVNPRGREKAERRMRWVAAYGVESGGALCKVITFLFTLGILPVAVSYGSVLDGTNVSQNKDTD